MPETEIINTSPTPTPNKLSDIKKKKKNQAYK